ncbi:inositol monophosphatase family protein [Actinoplanes friuliensis]|uniref:Myo-inositol-1(Or 4)-monophosphatase n=1 Tax=Actinoplanes friuliensis DSM 7358 TaxID=1246995 RepID=U5W4D3_9ACTN|nr:inositol monophosphatase family protein [Actinoplanes friuliensis]AGZ42850.1 myo-inositol-1(or 4)-monophosphatase [Actinoplanes friuliensis DSM 7358]
MTTLLQDVEIVVKEAGAHLLRRYSAGSRQDSFEDIVSSVRANDSAVLAILRPGLTAARPDAGWVDDEHASGPMPAGEWWVVDPVGGNVNTIHGLRDWNIGVTLVRDQQPVLAVLYSPLGDELYTAEAGAGAYLNGVRLTTSAKTGLDAALVGTGQAKPGLDPRNAALLGASVTAMLQAALYVRVSVPVTHQLSQVAAGRMDLHWQFDNVRSHLAGLLLIKEAGGVVTDLDGRPWDLTSEHYLAATPGLHAAALKVLAGS